jgi:hypothetical protein
MKTQLIAMAWLLCTAALFAKPHTPAPGTAERKAICDAMREYTIAAQKKTLAYSFLFKVEFMRVDGDYAGFQGFPVKPDGTLDDRFEDFVYTTFLRKKNGVWQVIRDLSRTDVPTDEEVRDIRKKFPADFPTAAMPQYWRKLLRP